MSRKNHKKEQNKQKNNHLSSNTSEDPENSLSKEASEVNNLNKRKVLWQIFLSTLYLSAFTFGGGYVIITLMKKRFVDELEWIEEDEMLDLVAIAQSSPGAIAVNGSVIIGYKLAGWLGIIVAVLGTIIPPFVIISIISFFYSWFSEITWIAVLLDGMQAGVGAVIAAVVLQMAFAVIKGRDKLLIIIMVVAFILNFLFEINVVYIILGTALLGLIRGIMGWAGTTK